MNNNQLNNEITVQLKYFGKLAGDLDCAEESVSLSTGSHLEDLVVLLRSRGNSWQNLENPTIKRALNQNIVKDNPALSHNDEIAFFPPVTGG